MNAKKMNISHFVRNIQGPFMIHPQQAAAMMPVIRAILTGTSLDAFIDEKKVGMKIACADYFAGKSISVGSGYEQKSIYVTYLEGSMTRHDSCYSYGTRSIAQELLKADLDEEIVGHIIVADSGGGAADSVPELADAIKQLSKPIVGYVDGMAASACIYALSYTDKIIAHQPTDQVGCIGTMITVSGWPKVRRDADGYVQIRIYADQSEEKNADYEQALEGNTQIIKEDVLNPLCQMFIDDMKANRPATPDEQLKGKTYFAKDVVGTLIDQIGSFDDAVNAIFEMAKQTEDKKSEMMNKHYPTLEAIPELAEQVYEEDGSTILQECQLEAIEQALTNPRPSEAELQAQIDSLTQSHTEEVAGLNQTIASRDETISQQNTRISELEAALEAADARNREEAPAAVPVDADPANANDEYAPAKTYEDAVAACKEYIANQNK